ncbi:hypothetical protein CEUSTIGMA_g13929.t1 [Chlamydomonas eustigma]|uniref:Uncharacterized protein n=1 Tax=Chlamydomonas eustigma TaxID=1157962 RepID=A0A250XUC7_9CHLO|nr:hypothetical protein CEUSTIGMA_g13929.t1 [Chlamydomonas eustigma]|eukprot:GAX86522.1 hypothetical protein CEUSTIGMA_g13929.t1 [Chlamydomonas eustigma]
MPKITKLTSANKRKGGSTSSLPAKSARKERVTPNDPLDDAFDREFLPPDNGREFLAPAPYKPAKRVFGGASLLTAGDDDDADDLADQCDIEMEEGDQNLDLENRFPLPEPGNTEQAGNISALQVLQVQERQGTIFGISIDIFKLMSFDEQRTIMNHHHLCKPGPSNGPDHQVHLSAGPQAVFLSSTDSTNIPASIAPAGVMTYANPYIRDSAYMKKIEGEVISKKLAKGDKVLLTDEDLKTILIKSSKFISYQAQHDPHYPASAHFMQYFELRDIVGVPKSCPVGVLGGLAQMRILYGNQLGQHSTRAWQQFAASHQKRLPTKKDRDERLLHDLAIWAKQMLQKFGDGLEIYRSSSQPYDAIPFVAAIAAGLKMPLHNNLPERVPQVTKQWLAYFSFKIRNHLRAHSGDKEVMARGDKHNDALDKELLEVESNISTLGMEKITSLIIVRSIEE